MYSITILPGPTPANFVGYVDGLGCPKPIDLDKARAHIWRMTPWPDGGITLDYVYVTEFPREEIPGLDPARRLGGIEYRAQHDSDALARHGCQLRHDGDRSGYHQYLHLATIPRSRMPISTISIILINGAASILAASTTTIASTSCWIKRARVTGDAAEARQAMYTEVQEIVAAEQPSVWMYTEDSSISLNNCAKGFLSTRRCIRSRCCSRTCGWKTANSMLDLPPDILGGDFFIAYYRARWLQHLLTCN